MHKKRATLALSWAAFYMLILLPANAVVYAQILTQPQSVNDGGDIGDLNDVLIENAGGEFASLQTDNDSKTWITSGRWSLISIPSNSSQSNLSKVSFNATIDMVGTDNREKHQHELSDFKLVNRSIVSSDEGSVITLNGTSSIETDVGQHTDIPISVKILDNAPITLAMNTESDLINTKWIPEGGIISLWVDEDRLDDHFGHSPVYGGVRGK